MELYLYFPCFHGLGSHSFNIPVVTSLRTSHLKTPKHSKLEGVLKNTVIVLVTACILYIVNVSKGSVIYFFKVDYISLLKMESKSLFYTSIILRRTLYKAYGYSHQNGL
jgi:hypothetical protein